MIRKCISLFVCFISVVVLCLGQDKDSLIVNLKYGPTDPDLRFYFSTNNIDLFKVNIKNTSSQQAKVSLLSKEVWNGEVRKIDTVFSWKNDKYFTLKENSNLVFSVLAKEYNSDSIRFNFEFEKYMKTAYFKKTKTNHYSLRDGVLSLGENVKKSNKGIYPLLVYSLPYEDSKNPGYLYYCKLTGNDIDPKNWFREYGIKHYIIFDLVLE